MNYKGNKNEKDKILSLIDEGYPIGFGEDPGSLLELESCNNSDLVICSATEEDLNKVVEVENAAWPTTDGSMIATKEKFSIRQKIGGLLVAKAPNGELLGMISYQKPNWINSDNVSEMLHEFESGCWNDKPIEDVWKYLVEKYKIPEDWYKATNGGMIEKNGESIHNPDGDVSFLIGVAIHPKGRGKKLVDKLIQAALSKSKKDGIKFALGYARLPAYSEHPKIPVKEYAALKKDGTDLPLDYGLRFHVRNGAKLVCMIPNAMWDDSESLGYGALAIYDLSDAHEA